MPILYQEQHNWPWRWLESALSEASMANKTVIIAIVNKAYVEGDKPMLDMFLDGFWLGEDTRGLISHLLLVAVDQTSFERCKFLHLHCYKLKADGADFETEELYMSQDFIKMMWRRTLFLKEVLRRGYSFVFTDIDVLWLRNPFPRLTSFNENIDLQISVDKFNGDEWSQANPINTGFYMVRSNNRTISLFEEWYARRNNSTGLKEQDVLNNMMQEGFFRELGLSVRFLDTLYFSGFCEVSKDFNVVRTVHANCCRTISAKVADLTAAIHDWKRFKSLSDSNQPSTLTWTSHEIVRAPGRISTLVVFCIFNQTTDQCQPFTKINTNSKEDELESSLYKASMGTYKTVIIAIVNKAYVEGDKPMLDLFLDGFWHGEDTRGLISQLLLVAVDQTSFERCKFLHLHCHKLEADDPADFEAEKLYMSQDFINMMWRRTLFLKEMLKSEATISYSQT
ncbi:Nucleotide-diphospho-sugar transferase family protein [Prunus dulcis]|uniref:Nucleotide-diphospho-sugar transferase family protein n=1 Tax=Prunus dulcis TaxID=3755 RepID=A0A4Y1R228_PRUDU|nr:Nucleotide-diphospho-sugar transferase family protein [Prunus dulcis]